MIKRRKAFVRRLSSPYPTYILVARRLLPPSLQYRAAAFDLAILARAILAGVVDLFGPLWIVAFLRGVCVFSWLFFMIGLC